MRVAVADDSALFRSGLVRVLQDAGFEVTDEAPDATRLLALISARPPDVAIVDIRMPPTMRNEGLTAANEIRKRYPDVGVLILSTYIETDFAYSLISESRERVGYLLKDRVSDVDELVEAIHRIAKGGSVIDRDVVAQLVGRQRVHNPLDKLSDREREVLRLMAEGRSNQGIGEHLFLSARTVESHVASIFAKLELQPTADDHRRVLAVLTFLRS
jgi:DNA-binding NarL/FixJ family response regulator